MKRYIMIQTFEQFNKLYEGDNQEMIDNKENDNIIKDALLYNDFPRDADKSDRPWEEAIQIIRDSKYNVRCALLGTDKYTRYDWGSPYEFKYKDKTYRYNKNIHRNDSIINEIERINEITKSAYKKICICEGVIEYTILHRGRRATYLIIPLNEDGGKIKRANVEILSPKYLLRIEKDILDGYDIETSVKDRYINKIRAARSKKDIDIILKDAFKVTTQEIYSIIFAYSLCREIEYEIWELTEINNENEEIIKAIEDKFGFKYFNEE